MWNRNRPAIQRTLTCMGAALTAGLLALLLAGTAHAEPPSRFQYEGRLFDDAGAPLAGPVDLTLELWDAQSGGSSLYAETHAGVTLSDGAFSLAMGEGTPSGDAFAADLLENEVFLEVTVGTDTLTPRQALHPTPQALVAQRAETLQGGETLLTDVAALQAADTTLQTNIDAEGAKRSSDDAVLDTRVTSLEARPTIFASGDIVDNSLTAEDLAPDSVGNSELVEDVSLTNLIVSSGVATTGSREIPSDIWTPSATWIQGAGGSLGTQGNYALSLIHNGYRQASSTFGTCSSGSNAGLACSDDSDCEGIAGACMCPSGNATECGFTLLGVGPTGSGSEKREVMNMLDLDGGGFHFYSEDYGDGEYPRKGVAKPTRRMFISPDGQVGINKSTDVTGWSNPSAKLDVGGDATVSGDITFGAENTSLTAALASAGHGVLEINQDCAENTGCFAGDVAGFPVSIPSPGSYRLTSNLTVPDEYTTAIYVQASDVGIDLNNFAIIGPVTCSDSPSFACTPAGGSGGGVKVDDLSRYGVSVKNGSVTGMGRDGVYLGNQAEITNLRVHHNGWKGIYAASGSTVSGNTARSNGGDGIYAASGSTVSGNTARSNGAHGIYAGGGSTVSGNTANSNAFTGFWVLGGSTISDNTANSNAGSGIYAASGSTVSGNTANSNASNGFWVLDGSTISDNTASYNTGPGIYTTDGSMVSGNTAYNNAGGGLQLFGAMTAYRDNVIGSNQGYSTVFGGVNAGGNVCDGSTTCP